MRKFRNLILSSVLSYQLFPAMQALGDEQSPVDILEKSVGKTISVVGMYSQCGKVGPFVLTSEIPKKQIYLLDVKTTFSEGAKIKAVGILRYSPGYESHNDAIASALPYYYFEGAHLKLEEIK
jgi:hypothetical protein